MRLKDKYKKEISPELKEKFAFKNVNLVPKLQKVVLNVGVGKSAKEKEFLAYVAKNLEKLTGQKSVFTLAKKSISAFKVREGMTVGVKVTLRGQRMYDFIEKLVGITFPRVRDFRGIDENIVDRTGNMTIGFKDHSAFPEIKVEDVESIFGLEVCVSSTAKNKEEGLALYRSLGFPFKKTNK